jgi:enoyl-CoA hydratase/carnithine racemase
MLFTGRMISAQEAERYGLINQVVPAEQLAAETSALAARIAEASPLALSIGKEAFYYAKGVIVNNLFAEDAKEGLSAFLEKRQPTWKGK